jgi:hypothetical protein
MNYPNFHLQRGKPGATLQHISVFKPKNKHYGQNPRQHVIFINSSQLDGKYPPPLGYTSSGKGSR